MSCTICCNLTVGLKTVQCVKPCSAVYCSKCWSEMNEHHKTYCILCKRKFPSVITKSKKNAIIVRLIIIAVLLAVFVVWWPTVSFEEIQHCNYKCVKHGKSIYCNDAPKLCETAKCAMDCLDIHSLHCYSAEKVCQIQYVDAESRRFMVFVLCSSLVIIASVVDICNYVKYKEVEPM